MLVGHSYSHAVESQWIEGVFLFPFPYDENLNRVSIQNIVITHGEGLVLEWSGKCSELQVSKYVDFLLTFFLFLFSCKK